MRFNIWKDFEQKPLPDVLSFVVDNRGKTVPTDVNGNHILIATNCIRNENLYPSYEKVRLLSEDTYQNWFRAHPEPGDIMFVNKGTPGRVCMVPDPIDFCIAQDMVALRANEDIVYNKYLFAILRSWKIQSQITSTTVGDVIPHFKKQQLKEIMIPIPPMRVQKMIGDYYFAFSKKIELNKNINDNLLFQMLLLFDNAREKASWTEQKLENVMEFYDQKRKPLSSRQRDGMHRNYPYYGATTIVDYVEDYIFDGTYILISEDGANVVDENGHPLTQYTFGKFWINNHAHIVKGSNGFSEALLLALLGTINMRSIVTGAAQPKINQANLRNFKTLLPDENEAKKLSNLMDPMLNMMIKNDKENQSLTELRDSLLPKLMSGELDISALNI
ncbi:restriction endonuclease subunit S [Pseudobutyrivibrio ruminis]|uniref:restriction endonuclease subunit S n=1 Tax=Pseudobutyrivibrio ruminis TaxID=46206 RepID=UPI001670AF02|nr:restriction endonuclease subunit S [Pseudobutyrivibrio ruminis]